MNLAVKWSGIKNLAIKLGVRNILDHLPPYTDVSSNGSHAAGWANAVADPAAGSGTRSSRTASSKRGNKREDDGGLRPPVIIRES